MLLLENVELAFWHYYWYPSSFEMALMPVLISKRSTFLNLITIQSLHCLGYGAGTAGLERIRLLPACTVWVLGFVWDRFHNTSPGDFGSIFIKAGDSETKEGLRAEEATGA